MIEVIDIRRYDDLEFSLYRKLEGYSFSFLAREYFGSQKEIEETEKIRLGKLVDSILTSPDKADMSEPLYPAAKSIAFEINKTFGDYISRLEKQVSFSAGLIHNDHLLIVKGRLDFLLPGHAVIDLKVTHTRDIDALIRHMGYAHQLSGYCMMAGVKRRYILIHSVPLKKTFLKDLGVITPYSEFWAAKIMKFGTPVYQGETDVHEI